MISIQLFFCHVLPAFKCVTGNHGIFFICLLAYQAVGNNIGLVVRNSAQASTRIRYHGSAFQSEGHAI